MQKTALPVTRMERQDVIMTNATQSLSSTALTGTVLVREVTCGNIIPNMLTVILLTFIHVEVDTASSTLYNSNHIMMS